MELNWSKLDPKPMLGGQDGCRKEQEGCKKATETYVREQEYLRKKEQEACRKAFKGHVGKKNRKLRRKTRSLQEGREAA